jgi:hypothetical protein
LTSVINAVKVKLANVVPQGFTPAELALIYMPTVKMQLDNLSEKQFASRSNGELLELSGKYAALLIMRPIQLKRNRPLIPMTTGTYTTFARRVQRVSLIYTLPMLVLSVNEIARRKKADPTDSLIDDVRAVLSKPRL